MGIVEIADKCFVEGAHPIPSHFLNID